MIKDGVLRHATDVGIRHLPVRQRSFECSVRNAVNNKPKATDTQDLPVVPFSLSLVDILFRHYPVGMVKSYISIFFASPTCFCGVVFVRVCCWSVQNI